MKNILNFIYNIIITFIIFAVLILVAGIAAVYGYNNCRETGASYHECMR